MAVCSPMLANDHGLLRVMDRKHCLSAPNKLLGNVDGHGAFAACIAPAHKEDSIANFDGRHFLNKNSLLHGDPSVSFSDDEARTVPIDSQRLFLTNAERAA